MNPIASKLPKILFFLADGVPTEEEVAAATELAGKATVNFRNSAFVGEEGTPETCDGVAGLVPKLYADKCRPADDVVADWDYKLGRPAAQEDAETGDDGAEDAPAGGKAPQAVAKATPPVPKPSGKGWTPNA